MKVAIVGMGHVGRGFALAFRRARVRRAPIDQADVVILSVRDDQISAAVNEIVPRLTPRHVVFHTSGLHTSELLVAAKARGAAIGSLHPLLSFANSTRAAETLCTATFAIEGDPRAIRTARTLVRLLGARAIVLRPSDKSRYHAAAVFSSNYVVASVAVACELLESLGLSERRALSMLTVLTDGVVRNLRAGSLKGALSGPIVRGDAETVRRHMDAVGTPARRALYAELGDVLVRIADLPPEKRRAVSKALRDRKQRWPNS